MILIYRELQEKSAGLLAQRIVPSARGVVCMAAAASLDHVVPVQEAEAEDEKLRWRWGVLKYQQQQKSTFQSTFQFKIASQVCYNLLLKLHPTPCLATCQPHCESSWTIPPSPSIIHTSDEELGFPRNYRWEIFAHLPKFPGICKSIKMTYFGLKIIDNSLFTQSSNS